MTAVVIALTILCVISTGAFFYMTHLRTQDWAHHQKIQDRDHDTCLHLVTHYVGDTFAAQVLRVAAEDYDSAEEMGRIKILVREEYKEGGPSVPALWLLDRAERLLPEEEA